MCMTAVWGRTTYECDGHVYGHILYNKSKFYCIHCTVVAIKCKSSLACNSVNC